MGKKFLKNKDQDMRHILLDLLNTNSYGSTVGLVGNLTGNQSTSHRESQHIWALAYNRSRPRGSESRVEFLIKLNLSTAPRKNS